MPDQIPEEVKEERRDAILELQQEIAFDKAADMVGRTLYAMIEGKVADEPAYVARTYADSPDIDRLCLCQHRRDADVRRFCKSKDHRFRRIRSDRRACITSSFCDRKK